MQKKLISFIILSVYIILTSLGMVLIKKGTTDFFFNINKGIFKIYFSFSFLIGIILYLISFVLWIKVLSFFDLTFISPVAYGIVYICIAFLSKYILNQSITIPQIIGTMLIVSGIIVSSVF